MESLEPPVKRYLTGRRSSHSSTVKLHDSFQMRHGRKSILHSVESVIFHLNPLIVGLSVFDLNITYEIIEPCRPTSLILLVVSKKHNMPFLWSCKHGIMKDVWNYRTTHSRLVQQMPRVEFC